MKRLCVGLVLAGMLLGAGGVRADPFIWGYGSDSCGNWIADRKDPSRSLVAHYRLIWVEGYISGLNVGLPITATQTGQMGANTD
jgi:hypothetical protein